MKLGEKEIDFKRDEEDGKNYLSLSGWFNDGGGRMEFIRKKRKKRRRDLWWKEDLWNI